MVYITSKLEWNVLERKPEEVGRGRERAWRDREGRGRGEGEKGEGRM